MCRTFTCTGIPKHWRLSWFRYKIFIIFLTFRFLTRGERDTIFTMLTVPSEPTMRGASRRPNWTLRISTNCFFFSKITPNPQLIASGHDVIYIPSPISYLGFLLWHLWLLHPSCTSMNTCTQCVPLPVH